MWWAPAASPLCNTTPESGSCIDLDGNTAGTITSTSISLLAGHNYTFAFNIFGTEREPNNPFPTSATVTLGSFYNNTFALNPTDQNVISTNFFVATDASANIVFASLDAPGSLRGALIDNVSVTDNGSTVPEPGSASFLLIGLPLAWGLKRLRG